MVFSSLEFLFLFLPITILGFLLIKLKYANIWLLLCSLAFYYLSDPQHIVVLLSIILIAYVAGLLIQKSHTIILKRVVMGIAVFAMLLTMSYFKYWNFTISNINLIFHKNIPQSNIIFPVGISFFVFQAVSYVIDVYRGEEALQNPCDMALYISFFPQLIAGPIVRYCDISRYMGEENRKIKIENFSNGIWRFCIGLSKKVLLANNLGTLTSIVFSVRDISEFSVLYTWLGAIAYTFQIYFDFSGYSDMAIGLGKIFGFEFQENFNYPYIAKSVKDFWRRWHISLSQFFRDYVYIPLGGNRCSKGRWIFNMSVVWLLTGIWHGAAWHYIFWGCLYGVIIIFENLIPFKIKNAVVQAVLSHIYTLLIVISLWVVFRANGLPQAGLFLKNMFGFGTKKFIDHGFIFQAENFAILLMISAIASMPVAPYFDRKYAGSDVFHTLETIGLLCCTIASISYIYMGSYNPFLYFMF